MKKKRFLALAGLFILTSGVHGTFIQEKFTTDPSLAGWQTIGQTNLFRWDMPSQNLQVTWDSAQSNSYFLHPLGATFTRTNDFLLMFDLRLDDIACGMDGNKPFTFQIALGLQNMADAASPGFIVGSGYEAPNLVEFNYFPDSGYGATFSTPMISQDNNFASGGFTYPLELATNTLYRVTMIYTAANATLYTMLTSNGVPVGPIKNATLGAGFGDFRVDAVSISSYNDAGQFSGYEGSVLAHGIVDNLAVASPLPLTQLSCPVTGQVQFQSDSHWFYTLERSANLQSWDNIAPATPGNGAVLVLQDAYSPTDKMFYRVNAQLP